ncbi:DUF2920 family protein, partial [Campylobacter coli]
FTIFTKDDVSNLSQALLEIGVNINVNLENAQQCYELLNQNITTLKSQRKLAQNYQAKFTSTFIPPNGDYQNYGIMAALDHINALKDLVKRFPEFADLPKIYGGGSYGGYLSLLIAKIAPWYVDGVIDNSGSAVPPLIYILGREMEGGCDYVFNDPNTLIECFLKTHWTR